VKSQFTESILHNEIEPARAASKSDFSAEATGLSNLRAIDRSECSCRSCNDAALVDRMEPLTVRENLLVWVLMLGGTAGLALIAVRVFA
jgi:hypothetical protein